MGNMRCYFWPNCLFGCCRTLFKYVKVPRLTLLQVQFILSADNIFEEVGKITQREWSTMYYQYKKLIEVNAETDGMKMTMRFWNTHVFEGVPQGNTRVRKQTVQESIDYDTDGDEEAIRKALAADGNSDMNEFSMLSDGDNDEELDFGHNDDIITAAPSPSPSVFARVAHRDIPQHPAVASASAITLQQPITRPCVSTLTAPTCPSSISSFSIPAPRISTSEPVNQTQHEDPRNHGADSDVHEASLVTLTDAIALGNSSRAGKCGGKRGRGIGKGRGVVPVDGGLQRTTCSRVVRS